MGAAESSLQKPSLDFDNLNLYEVLGVSTEASDDEIKVRMTTITTSSLLILGSWIAGISSTRIGNSS
jgi:hypothetical protein